MRKSILAIAAAAMVLPAAPAAADPPRWAPAYGQRDNDRHHGDDRRDYRRDDRRQSRVYDDRGRYIEPRRISRNDRVWRGDDNRYYCKRDNGTTGLIIGAAGGALLGREIDGGRDRAVGTILGAAIGGLLGREIDRGEARCR
ncbi:glycine zipper 2TM domain-containing protein [Alteraurantiacibacter aestuarii]|uniref:17 kDa surface antigen n=1 Tax=Alteraurantiacibacter aestuarii TaxID=650004 RepID=A0A844ZIZ5_9SPHN|nr:glycine zipper 2TM domain-containing protein [Alteraurantiacibacter aestuarii]MXO87755.1 glycine zipper 2TM domain-containing protein [Alteraurantiacibacter aestuarii]